MDTKIKGDIAEKAAVLEGLKRGWGVLEPVGDRLPYDLVFDVEGVLVKIQVKHAWLHNSSGNFIVDTRRTKTNRRKMVRETYSVSDFDFALVYIENVNIFYILPVGVFISYGSGIHFVETDKRQRRPKSADYRDAWELISQWAVQGETFARSSVKFGEADSRVIPSQVFEAVKLNQRKV